MRRADMPHPVPAELEDLAVGERHGRPVGQVVQRHHAAERPMGGFGLRRCGEQLVHGPALVGFDMAEGDPAEPVKRGDRGDGLGEEREGGSVSGMEQQRLLVVDEVLVEGEPAGPVPGTKVENR
jgi:hypothetical protein